MDEHPVERHLREQRETRARLAEELADRGVVTVPADGNVEIGDFAEIGDEVCFDLVIEINTPGGESDRPVVGYLPEIEDAMIARVQDKLHELRHAPNDAEKARAVLEAAFDE